jgi:acylphosphatase
MSCHEGQSTGSAPLAGHCATELGLVGYVRNVWDGTVEVVAEGKRTGLEDLLAFLRVGPPAAMVAEVEVRWAAPTHAFDRFEVRY